VLYWAFALNSATAAAEKWDLKRPDLKIWKNVVMDYCNVSTLDLT